MVVDIKNYDFYCFSFQVLMALLPGGMYVIFLVHLLLIPDHFQVTW